MQAQLVAEGPTTSSARPSAESGASVAEPIVIDSEPQQDVGEPQPKPPHADVSISDPQHVQMIQNDGLAPEVAQMLMSAIAKSHQILSTLVQASTATSSSLPPAVQPSDPTQAVSQDVPADPQVIGSCKLCRGSMWDFEDVTTLGCGHM